MKVIRYTLGPFVAIGMLAALAVGATAQGTESPSPVASSPAASASAEQGVLVTGTFTSNRADAAFAEDTEVAYGRRQRGRDYTGTVAMDDARLSGDVTGTDNADRYFHDEWEGDILWGTIEIRNNGGTWVGTSDGTTDKSTGDSGVTHYQLAGTEAYEGLSAIIFEREVPVGEPVWNGVIFPGERPLTADG